MPSHADRLDKPNGKPKSLVGDADEVKPKPTPGDEGTYENDGCGLSFRTPGKTLRVVLTATKRVWNIDYHDMLTGPCEMLGGLLGVFPFRYNDFRFHLLIHGNPAYVGDPTKGLAPLLMRISEGYQRTLHAGCDYVGPDPQPPGDSRILKVDIRDDQGKVVGEDEIEKWVLKLEAGGK